MLSGLGAATFYAPPGDCHAVLDSGIMSLRRFFQLFFRVLCAVVFCQFHAAGQESKPQAGSPPATSGGLENSLESNPVPAHPEIAALQGLATQLLHHADKAGCHKGSCTILVLDFVFPDGHTCRYCAKLAEELSAEMAQRQDSVRIMDRALLQSVLEQERIPAQLQREEPVARWVGKRVNATVVLLGTAKKAEQGSFQLSAHLMNVTDGKHSGPTADVSFLANEEAADFKPTDGLPALPPITATQDGEKIYKVNRGSGVSAPSCSYMPPPSYTEEARKAKFSGTVLEEGIINADGTLEPIRVVRGAPFGLNGAAYTAMTTWKCRAATSEGKPVPTVVSFEVSFRLY